MSKAYQLHGAALRDAFRGDQHVVLGCLQDGARDDVPASFWLRETIDPLEALALDQCRGHILDVGAGAGVHALELQRRGLAVTALDIAAECVDVMRARGVRDAVVGDFDEFVGGPFDTVISLCNGLDKVGQLHRLPHFLERVRSVLAYGGQLLIDSFEGVGELALQFSYNGVQGEPFSTLQLDFATLARCAQASGFTCEKLQALGAHYLARLCPR